MIRATLVDRIATKTCPECGNYVDRRQDECCPFCGIHLEALSVVDRTGPAKGVRTIWVRRSPRAKDLVELLRAYIRTVVGDQKWDFLQYGRELGQANLLIALCDGEADIAELAIEAYFVPNRPTTIWVQPRSMGHVVGPCINEAVNWAWRHSKLKRRVEPTAQLPLIMEGVDA